MTQANFAALLETNVDVIEKPKVMPMGTYAFKVLDHEFGESSQKKTPFVQFNCSPISALEDVDEELLAEIPKWQERKMRVTLYITDDSLFRLKDFLEHCGLDATDRTLAELIPEVTGAMFNGFVKQQASQNDPSEFFAFIDKTMPAE